MGENNIIGTDEEYPYIYISYTGAAYELILQEKGDFTGSTKEVYKYSNGIEETNLLNDIGDYTGFYIIADYVVPDEIPESVHQIFKQK